MGLQYVENVIDRGIQLPADYRTNTRLHPRPAQPPGTHAERAHRPSPHARNCLLHNYLPAAGCTECPRCSKFRIALNTSG